MSVRPPDSIFECSTSIFLCYLSVQRGKQVIIVFEGEINYFVWLVTIDSVTDDEFMLNV